MENRNQLASDFVFLESQLNNMEFKGVKIGSVMAFYWGLLYKGNYTEKFYFLFLRILKYHLRIFQPLPKLSIPNKRILYFKSGTFKHHNKIEESILNTDNQRKITLKIGLKDKRAVDKNKILKAHTIIDVFIVWVFIVRHSHQIDSIFRKQKFNFSLRIKLLMILFVQLIKTKNTLEFFRYHSDLNTVCGDYDRGQDSAIFFAVAKSLKIKSFTVQHGVINPPYGYVPLIAEDILVWGEMAKQQLIEMGVKKDQIHIVGNPILELINKSDKNRNDVLNKYDFGEGKNVILAINPIRKEYNISLIKFFIQIKNRYPTNNYYIKLHPAQKREDFLFVKYNYDLEVISNLEFTDFIQFADIILAHNTGLLLESLYYKLKIGVLDVLPISTGNGEELIKHFGIPRIVHFADFEKVIKMDIKKDINYIFKDLGRSSVKNIQMYLHEKQIN